MLYRLSNVNGKILHICKNNIKECVPDTASDSNEKIERNWNKAMDYTGNNKKNG
jgi:hypothetical protein